MPTPLDERLCGVRLSNIEGYARLKFKLRQQKGVVVTKVMKGGLGERYGLRPGDVIIRINNAEVADKNSVHRAYGGRFAKELYSLSGEEERRDFFPPDKTRHLTLGGMMEAEKETSADKGKKGKGEARRSGCGKGPGADDRPITSFSTSLAFPHLSSPSLHRPLCTLESCRTHSATRKR